MLRIKLLVSLETGKTSWNVVQTCVRRLQFLRQMNATLGTGNSLLINDHLILLASCNLRKIKYNRST